jgi:gamma-glutamylcyclotransferase (GGCT)/AIG2-like uncharacterized protein YtfP
MLVFVYGTLKRGYGNNRILQHGQAVFLSEGVVRGFRIFGVGFPIAQIHDESSVLGELWDIGYDDEPRMARTLANLDSLEGYRENDPDHSMYIRKEVLVETDEGTKEASMYVGNVPFWDRREYNWCPKNEDGHHVWSR